jgi:hypothetical protein
MGYLGKVVRLCSYVAAIQTLFPTLSYVIRPPSALREPVVFRTLVMRIPSTYRLTRMPVAG